jgi:5-methylthioadenosine/S-adenosylhomocysteine deaminase
MKTILKNATLLPEYGFGSRRVQITVENKRITEISEKMPDAVGAEIVDCKGDLLIPAFYNAHCHAAMTLFRGYGEDLPLDRWLNERIFPAEDRLNAKAVNVATKLAIAEMIANGVCSFSDMYMFMDEVAKAVIETGIKANLSRSIVSFSDIDDLNSESRFLESVKLVKDYNGAADGKLIIYMSLHAEYTNTEQMTRFIAEYTKENKLGMQVHISET